MEQTLIFSGVMRFPGRIFRKESLPVPSCTWVTGLGTSGIIASDWLYPRKPKKPI